MQYVFNVFVIKFLERKENFLMNFSKKSNWESFFSTNFEKYFRRYLKKLWLFADGNRKINYPDFQQMLINQICYYCSSLISCEFTMHVFYKNSHRERMFFIVFLFQKFTFKLVFFKWPIHRQIVMAFDFADFPFLKRLQIVVSIAFTNIFCLKYSSLNYISL